MEQSSLFQSRYTCRAYQNKAIAKECLVQVLQDATRAPSWANSQPWEIYVAAGEKLAELRAAYSESFAKGEPVNPDIPRPESWPAHIQARMDQLIAEKFSKIGIARDDQVARHEHLKNNFLFFGAPAVLFLCIDRTLTEWSVFDLGQLSQSLMLAAKAHGLDSAPAFSFVSYPHHLRKILEIPDELKIVVGISIGYGDPDHPQNHYRTRRVALDEVVRWKGFE